MDMSLAVTDNATLFLTTPAMRTQVQCVPGSVTMSNDKNNTDDSIVMTASLGSGYSGFNTSCQFNVSIDTPSVNWQSGASAVVPSCNQFITSGSKSGSPPDDLQLDYRSVAFWVFNWGDKAGAAIFCTPQITAQLVQVETILANNTIRNVSITGPFSSGNNVTGAPLNGWAYNGSVIHCLDDTRDQN